MSERINPTAQGIFPWVPGSADDVIALKIREGCSLSEIAGALVYFGLCEPSGAESEVLRYIMS